MLTCVSLVCSLSPLQYRRLVLVDGRRLHVGDKGRPGYAHGLGEGLWSQPACEEADGKWEDDEGVGRHQNGAGWEYDCADSGEEVRNVAPRTNYSLARRV